MSVSVTLNHVGEGYINSYATYIHTHTNTYTHTRTQTQTQIKRRARDRYTKSRTNKIINPQTKCVAHKGEDHSHLCMHSDPCLLVGISPSSPPPAAASPTFFSTSPLARFFPGSGCQKMEKEQVEGSVAKRGGKVRIIILFGQKWVSRIKYIMCVRSCTKCVSNACTQGAQKRGTGPSFFVLFACFFVCVSWILVRLPIRCRRKGPQQIQQERRSEIVRTLASARQVVVSFESCCS